MSQVIKLKRGGIEGITLTAPSSVKGELILGTGSFSNGLTGSLFIAEDDSKLRLPYTRIDSINDGAALATNIGSNNAFDGLLIHSASNNKLYRYNGTAFAELQISAGAADSVTGVLSNGTGIAALSYNGSAGASVAIASEGVGVNQIASAIAGNGITGGAGSALSVQNLNDTIDVASGGISVNTGSIAENGTNLVDAGTLFTLSSSIATDITNNTGNVEGVTGQVAYFDGTNSVSGSTGFTFASDVLTVGTSTFGLNTTIAGNLTVAGTTTTIDSTNVNIGDRIIVLNTAEASQDGGIQVIDTDGNQTGSLLWDRASNYWKAGLEGGTHYRLPELTSTTNITDNTLIVADSNGRLEGSGKFTEDGTNGIVDAPKFTNLAGANTDGAGVLIIEPTSNEVTSVTTEGSDELAHIFGTKTDGTLVFSNVIDGGTF